MNERISILELRYQIFGTFENFNAVGQWRDLDAGFPIDPAGKLPDGTSFMEKTVEITVDVLNGDLAKYESNGE